MIPPSLRAAVIRDYQAGYNTRTIAATRGLSIKEVTRIIAPLRCCSKPLQMHHTPERQQLQNARQEMLDAGFDQRVVDANFPADGS